MTPDGWSFALKSSDAGADANQVTLKLGNPLKIGFWFWVALSNNNPYSVAEHATGRPSGPKLGICIDRPLLTSPHDVAVYCSK